jgi:S-DNA-T family DNA segregation ATPase FtsK/SpoIIIE
MARAAPRSRREVALEIVQLAWSHPTTARFRGGMVAATGAALLIALAGYRVSDPSWNAAGPTGPRNLLGGTGALAADVGMQTFGLAAWLGAAFMVLAGLWRAADREPDARRRRLRQKALAAIGAMVAGAGAFAALGQPTIWPLATGLGGLLGDGVLGLFAGLFQFAHLPGATAVAGVLLAIAALVALNVALGVTPAEYAHAGRSLAGMIGRSRPRAPEPKAARPTRRAEVAKRLAVPVEEEEAPLDIDDEDDLPAAPPVVAGISKPKSSKREVRENQKAFDFVQPDGFAMPELAMLAKPKPRQTTIDE